MGRIAVTNNVTLDGIMQGPAGPDEDPRDGFTHGGWAATHSDEELQAKMAAGMGETRAMLFGRHTYEQFASYWPTAPQPNPFSDYLNAIPKYVCSNTLSDKLPWQNSTLLRGDAVETVTALKEQYDGTIAMLGSGDLLQTLLRAGLVDSLTLLVHPVVLGSGRKLFAGGQLASMTLVESSATAKGVIVATYQPMA